MELNAAYWRNHLAFRDALRTQPETAAAYARLKAELAAPSRMTARPTLDAKGEFVARVLAGAWARARHRNQLAGRIYSPPADVISQLLIAV